MKISRFETHLLNCREFDAPPILAISENKLSNLIAVLRNEGPIEIWKIKKNHIFFLQKIHNASNFIADDICWCKNRLFGSGITGSIVEYDLKNGNGVKYVIQENFGSIWAISVDPTHNYIAAGTDSGKLVIYQVLPEVLEDLNTLDDDTNDNIRSNLLLKKSKRFEPKLQIIDTCYPSSSLTSKSAKKSKNKEGTFSNQNSQERITCLAWWNNVESLEIEDSYNISDHLYVAFATTHNPIANHELYNDNEDDDIEQGSILPIDTTIETMEELEMARRKKRKNDAKKVTRNYGKIYIYPVSHLYDVPNGETNANIKHSLPRYRVISLEFLAREERFAMLNLQQVTKHQGGKNITESDEYHDNNSSLSNITSLFVNALLFCEGNRTLISADTYGAIRFWSTQSCQLLKTISGIHNGPLLCMTPHSKNPNIFYASGTDPIIVQYERNSEGEWFKSHQHTLHENDVKALCHINGWLFSGGLDTKIIASKYNPVTTVVQIPSIPYSTLNSCSFSHGFTGINVRNNDKNNEKESNFFALFQYLTRLEVWQISTSAEHHEQKIVELRTNPNVKLPLEIVCSAISPCANYVAYSDVGRTHIYRFCPKNYLMGNAIDTDKVLQKLKNIRLNGSTYLKFLPYLERTNNKKIDNFNIYDRETFTKPKLHNDKTTTFIPESNLESHNNEIDTNIMSPKASPLILCVKLRFKLVLFLIRSCPANLIHLPYNGLRNLIEYDELKKSHKEMLEDKYSLANNEQIPHYFAMHCLATILDPCITNVQTDAKKSQFPLGDSVMAVSTNLEHLYYNNGEYLTENKVTPNYNHIAISYSSGLVCIYELPKCDKIIWKMERQHYPCTSLVFHPSNLYITLLYADNYICEYDIHSNESTLWSTFFNMSLKLIIDASSSSKQQSISEKDNDFTEQKTTLTKYIKHFARFHVPWLVPHATKTKKTKKLKKNGLYTDPTLRGIMFNPQNANQLICYDLETVFTISKQGCYAIEELKSTYQKENPYPAIEEYKKYKYCVYLEPLDKNNLGVVEIKSDSIINHLLPAMKKKRYGV